VGDDRLVGGPGFDTLDGGPGFDDCADEEQVSGCEPLARFDQAEVTVGDETWLVAVADTPALRTQGLTGVADLGEIDGMLFVWASDTTAAFWMKDTLIPLDLAAFSADGVLVDVLTMVPCTADPCPLYRPAGPYRYALEAPAGRLSAIDDLTLGY
jgi:uncharacterized membrane protein (UPF0127 family)